MLDAAFAAAEMIEKQAAHDAPPHAGAPRTSGVGIGGADHAFGDEIVDLPAKGRLQTVGDMSG